MQTSKDLFNPMHNLIIQNVSDFFIAGSETTATSLQWAMLFMANNQEVQEKVFKEIDATLAEDEVIHLQVG